MDPAFYLQTFQEAEHKLDKKLLFQKGLESAVVLYKKDCVVLKLYKRAWANPFQDPLTAASRIFFSIWVCHSTVGQKKLFYNIHALKLRQLEGYTIQSIKFATIFRDSFKAFEHRWQNVSVAFGPLTLMEGWLPIHKGNLEEDILQLAHHFLQIEQLIDNTLAHFK